MRKFQLIVLVVQVALPLCLSAQLNMQQIKDMHQDDKNLLDNLASRRFSEISDARWSRFNQWLVLKAVIDAKCRIPEVKQPVADILVKETMDISYFMKEPQHTLLSNGNMDSMVLYIGYAGNNNYKWMMETIEKNGCSSPRVVGILTGAGLLYAERKDLPRTEAAPTPTPVTKRSFDGKVDTSWVEEMRRELHKLLDGQSYSVVSSSLDDYLQAPDDPHSESRKADWWAVQRVFVKYSPGCSPLAAPVNPVPCHIVQLLQEVQEHLAKD